MAIVRFNPVLDLERAIGSFFDSGKDESNFYGFTPRVNTRETSEHYIVEMELPGIAKEDIDIEVTNNNLVISGEKKYFNEAKESDYYKLESRFGKFSRSFVLPENADKDAISAKTKNGILELSLAKTKVAQNKKITID
ncbi:MAG: heat-shock protein Hsp20 [Deltaproteobacteria bacterium]|nr:MAG: heat-shock protein Hsp20 [Deltaproteobacteria bacterium]